jgi:hypothetical protein
MTSTEAIAVEALGQLEALNLPLRDPRASYWPAVWTLRERYPLAGLPWRGGASRERERDLDAAVESGLVERRKARMKTIGLRLTDEGMRSAWELTGNHRYSDIIVRNEVLARGPRGRWIAEVAFNGGAGWGDDRHGELAVIDRTNLQGLVTGLVEANCTVHGHVAYAATDLKPPPLPPGALELPFPNPDKAARDLYDRCFSETLIWLHSQTPEGVGERGSIGRIPLSYADLYVPRRRRPRPR